MQHKKFVIPVVVMLSLVLMGLLVPIKSKTLDDYCKEAPDSTKSFHLIRGQYVGYAGTREGRVESPADEPSCVVGPIIFKLYLL